MKTIRNLQRWLQAGFHKPVLWSMFLVLAMTCSAQAVITQAPVIGEITRITVDNPADIYSRGTIEVGGQSVIIPANYVIDLPANRLTLQQFFTQAPPDCLAAGETGLAKEDTCNTSNTGAAATILANRSDAGNVIAGDVFIEKAAESVLGTVTYIDYTDGYLRINGVVGDPTTGTMVRINDPSGRFTIQQGLGVADPANVVNGSADPRFGVDPDNYTTTFSTGYPACIPSTVTGGNRTVGADPISGAGDEFCPVTNRTGSNNPPDAFRFAPILVGDHISAEGNYEVINGVQFLSAHTLVVHVALVTTNGQPDYIIFDEVEWDVAGFNNERARTLFIGFSTRADSFVDIFALHIDPATGQETEHIVTSTVGCEAVGGAGTCTNQGIGVTAPGIFKLRYDVDFIDPTLIAKKPELYPCPVLQLSNLAQIGHTDPCSGLGQAASLAQNFRVVSPISRDLIGRSRNKVVGNGGGAFGDSMDITGSPSPNGEYLNPVGVGHPEFVEVNLNAIQTPLIFEGQPWNLDRRLGPGGSEVATNPGSTLLDPFPYSGLDPRAQTATPISTLFGATADRIFAFVTDPNADDQVLNGSLLSVYNALTPPAAEAILPIAPVDLTCPVIAPGAETLIVTRAEFDVSLSRLIVVATTDLAGTDTMAAEWGNGTGALDFIDIRPNGLFRYRGVFRNLPAAPTADASVTSSIGTIATSVITTLP